MLRVGGRRSFVTGARAPRAAAAPSRRWRRRPSWLRDGVCNTMRNAANVAETSTRSRDEGTQSSALDPALGVALRAMGELSWPADAAEQTAVASELRDQFVLPRSPGSEHSWDLMRPCVIRGFARDWDFVRCGRFDTSSGERWRQALSDESCVTEFQPSPSHLKYERVEDMEPSMRLVNPAALLLRFPDFLDACHLKRRQRGGGDGDNLAEEMALRETVRQAVLANVAYEGPGWEQNPRCAPLLPRNIAFDAAAAAEGFSLYCAQHDVAHWPRAVLDTIAPVDPASLLAPTWTPTPPTVNVWMSGGGPFGKPVSCNFHCDYSENFHVVLNGRKEFFMCHPLDVGLLHGTSYCAQMAWSLADGGDSGAGQPPTAYLEEVVRQDLRTPMCLASIDIPFEENCVRCPGFRSAAAARQTGVPAADLEDQSLWSPPLRAAECAELRHHIEGLDLVRRSAWHPSGPLWAELRAGDLVYIPPGWFHAVRTWHPAPEERGIPFAMSVNFWHACQEELWEKEKLFRIIEAWSMRQALVGDSAALLRDFLVRLRESPGG
eukprot:TRINITY_DN57863_c0_g1_i1.p1 TRINITY_DN57863_c0_g1~~TRINITY_DN57863_c0_g1_i1.p1  ORF type:complete len:549 (+),score=102.84 TRINITY_DN57863_c0_g1_i1:118-1764(+)